MKKGIWFILQHRPFASLSVFRRTWPGILFASLLIHGDFALAGSDGYLTRLGPAPLRFAQPMPSPNADEAQAWLAALTNPLPVFPASATNPPVVLPDAAKLPTEIAPLDETQLVPDISSTNTQVVLVPSFPEPSPLPQSEQTPLVTAQMLVPFFTGGHSNNLPLIVLPAFVPPLPPNSQSSTATYQVESPR